MGCCSIISSSSHFPAENFIRDILAKVKLNNHSINDIDEQFTVKFQNQVEDPTSPKSLIFTKALYSIVFSHNESSDSTILDEKDKKIIQSLFFLINAGEPISGNIRNYLFAYCLALASNDGEKKTISLFNYLESTNQNNLEGIQNFARLFFYANFYEYYDRIKSEVDDDKKQMFDAIGEKLYKPEKVWKYYDHVFKDFPQKEKYSIEDIDNLFNRGELLDWRTNREIYIQFSK